MNTDDTGSRRTPDDDPVVIGAGLRDVEARLRTSLRADADSIEPADRLDAILAAAQDGVSLTSDGDPHRRRWLMPAAAAAAAAVVAGTLWFSGRPSSNPLPPALTASVSSTTSQAPSTSPSSAPTSAAPSSAPTSAAPSSAPPSTAPTTDATPPVTTIAPPVTVTLPKSIPVYYVGARVPGGTAFALFREFVVAPVESPGAGQDKALAALRLATSAAPQGSDYRALWTGVKVSAVSVTSSRITVTLSTSLSGVAGGQAKLAVQQLVWTAQAAVGKGLLPVRFELADGSSNVAPGFPASGSYSQPTGQAAFSEISMIWISTPARGAALKAGPVTVSGVASVYEAAVAWQVLKGGSVVASGVDLASAGAPGRGNYSFATPSLAAGDYTVRVYSTSPKDGSVDNEARTAFTIR